MAITRRRLIAQSAAVPLLGTLGLADRIGAALAEEASGERGPPMPDLPISRLSPHVWMIFSPDGFPTPENQGMMANILFVEGTKGVIVVDTGASVEIGEMAVRQLKTVTSKPVIGIFNTHFHGDHWLGNQAFLAAYGKDLPIYAHPECRKAIAGATGIAWRDAMLKWTNAASLGTTITPPTVDVDHGFSIALGDVTLRIHHYGTAHTPCDLAIEVVGDGVTCVGDIMMDRRIANMEDGSYEGTFAAIDKLVANTKTTIWAPAHGVPGPKVIDWQREIFQGIWDRAVEAVKQGVPLEDALAFTLKDPRVSGKAKETKGFDRNIGKYVSLAYLEAEQSQF